MTTGVSSLPLSHITVLDLSRVLAGPWASQILADLGARVIKIERPKEGDDTRKWGPPYLKDLQGKETSESAYFLSANRGKESVTVDITTEEGQKIIRRLTEKADVLLENFKVGGLKKYGLDYESLKDTNPSLIYCSITGFGQSGPYAEKAGYDYMIQAMGGLMSITGQPEGTSGGEPMRVGLPIADIMTGMYSAIAILGALVARNSGGKGQYIDMALLDVQGAMLANQAMNYLVSGNTPGRLGNRHPNIVPYQAFKASDEYFIIAVGNDSQFRKLCTLLGQSALAEDLRFGTNRQRVEHREALVDILAPVIAQKPAASWLALLEKEGIPCGPIHTIAELMKNPQFLHRGMQTDIPHPLAGHMPAVKNPIHYSDTPLACNRPAPLLGEHTEKVLSELGYSSENIRKLREKDTV